MTNDLTGRALDEAAARAIHGENWYGAPQSIEAMLAWLHGRGGVEILTRKGYAAASQIDTDYHEGTDLREALARLVVAVAAREAKA